MLRPRKKYTVYDLQLLKGKRCLTHIHVKSPEEAAAAAAGSGDEGEEAPPPERRPAQPQRRSASGKALPAPRAPPQQPR